MIFLIAIIIGIFIGYLMKGTLQNLKTLSLNAPFLLLIFLLVDIFFNRLFTYFFPQYNRLFVIILLTLQYSAMFGLVICNKNRWPLWLVGIGEFLNFIVIIVNGGRMPVNISKPSMELRFEELKSGLIPHYGIMKEATAFAFLGDRIPIKFFATSLLSVGDIVIWLGLALLMVHGMKVQQKNNDPN